MYILKHIPVPFCVSLFLFEEERERRERERGDLFEETNAPFCSKYCIMYKYTYIHIFGNKIVLEIFLCSWLATTHCVTKHNIKNILSVCPLVNLVTKVVFNFYIG